jgi:hypothetical protein
MDSAQTEAPPPTLAAGDKAKARDILYASGTKVFHMNTDSVTNGWAANLIGRTRQWFQNLSTALPPAVQPLFDPLMGQRDQARTTAGMTQQETHEVPPSTFAVLRTGGERHGRQVDAVVFAGGRAWAPTRRPWLITTFSQEQQ